jgi:hypothetical protein
MQCISCLSALQLNLFLEIVSALDLQAQALTLANCRTLRSISIDCVWAAMAALNLVRSSVLNKAHCTFFQASTKLMDPLFDNDGADNG